MYQMLVRNFAALIVCAVTVVSAAISQASVHSFSQAELLGMTIDSSTGLTILPGGGDNTGGAQDALLSAGPGAGAYGGGNLETMTGVAGSNEFLSSSSSVFYALSVGDLAALNAAISAGDTLEIIGYNDNLNDNWILGIWYNDGSGIVTDSAMVAAGAGAAFSLDLDGTTLTDAGVFVATGNFNDQFHASWAPVPEPATIAVWVGLGAIGLFAGRRRFAQVS
jgi:hypothetical protein